MPITIPPPLARSMLVNGLMQTDLDADGHKIINLDTSNLPLGQPNPQPHVAHNFLASYDNTTHNFQIAQPITLDLSDWPDITGNIGKFLSVLPGGAPGPHIGWQSIPSTTGYINVKDPPYNAAGDGVTDDWPAITLAISNANGRSIYFPPGTYLVNSNISGTFSFVGDSPYTSVILGSTGIGSAIITLSTGCVITNMGVDGNLLAAVQPVPTARIGLYALNSNNIKIMGCRVVNCAGSGIDLIGCSNTVISSCDVDNCAFKGIHVEDSPKSRILLNRVTRCTEQGIRLVNSPYSVLQSNQVQSCALIVAGIEALDSDNTTIEANSVQQCAFGLNVLSSSGRLMQSYGMVITGNLFTRNYISGVRIALSNGFNLSGNTIVDNGHGGNNTAVTTMEPGICVNRASPGTGYQPGDVLTVSGGTGTPAKAFVKTVGGGGALNPDSLHPITLGSYTTLPPVNATLTGGSGSGAGCLFTVGKILTPGTGYTVGEVLRSNNGVFTNPIRIQVKAVSAGAITDYDVLDGGGYGSVSSAPPTGVTFTPDSISDGHSTGSGFQLAPNFGARYSQNFTAATLFGVCTVGNIQGGIIGSNIISTTRYGYAILVQDDVAPFVGRANWLCVTENSLMNNDLGPYAGQTVGSAPDNVYLFNSIFANNIIFPPLPGTT